MTPAERAQRIRVLRAMLAELEAANDDGEARGKSAPCETDEVAKQRIRQRARKALARHGLA